MKKIELYSIITMISTVISFVIYIIELAISNFKWAKLKRPKFIPLQEASKIVTTRTPAKQIFHSSPFG